MRQLIEWLREPNVSAVDVDGEQRLAVHSAMLARKRMLREVFFEFHRLFHSLDREYFTGEGKRIEMGSGVAPMRTSYPDVLATDIVASPHLDMVLDGQSMNLPDSSVRALFGQNCFHHFSDPTRFFQELERTVSPGGGVILLEPYFGPFASFLFKRLFHTEGFDKTFPDWETPVAGPMNGANQALSYLVFFRDRERFTREFPKLEIVEHRLLGNYPKYLLSGGLNFRQLLPDALVGAVTVLEWLLLPFRRVFALHHVIVIRRVA